MKVNRRLALRRLGATVVALAVLARFARPAERSQAKDLPLLQTWSGDYPVAELKRLPQDQRKSRTGYLGDKKIFDSVWHALKKDETTPRVDFVKNLVVFTRNVDFYNRTRIAGVKLTNGVVNIVAMETMSALPVEEKVVMALAVISRAGVKSIQAGNKQIAVSAKQTE